jgi:hypothetical protein
MPQLFEMLSSPLIGGAAMTAPQRSRFWPMVVLFLAALFPSLLAAGPKPETYWQVDEVRAGMKGHGRTVLKGTKLETFDAEVLGVLKNTNPGRDMVLCRLSGLNLERTGVIAGMSGSPIYIDGKLLGAVAYAWAFGKEPIAGVTPFSQMHEFVAAYEQRDLAEKTQPRRIGLHRPLTIDATRFVSVTVAQDFTDPPTAADNSLWLTPLRTPLAATGFTTQSLTLLRDRLKGSGLVPVQGGGAPGKVIEQEKDTPLLPGSALAVALITGDFDLSGIGTVTHIEGNRVYGWGHPFFDLGACDFALMTGYIHTIFPRQTVSFKMGSPLRTVGVINADVSTCVAGWLDRKPDMLPMRLAINRGPGTEAKNFHVEISRARGLLSPLVYTALSNSMDMEGDLPEEMTTELRVRLEVEGHAPIILEDTLSGYSYSGGRASQALYLPVAGLVHSLTTNPQQPVRIERIECMTRIVPVRRTAEVEAIELESETLGPGETLRASVYLQPFRGRRQRLRVQLPLPSDLPEGTYTATVCDDAANARYELRDNPNLANPHTVDQIFQALAVQTAAKHTTLAVRVSLPAAGVALGGHSLPHLPPSMVQILSAGRRTGAQTIGAALVSRHPTAWVIQGSETVRFTVAKNKRLWSQP